MNYMVKKRGFTAVALIILLGIGLLSCRARPSDPVTWEGTLPEFFVRENKMYMGNVEIPCERDDLIEEGIFPKGTKFPDDSRAADPPPYMTAPQKAYFSDVGEEAWVEYYSYEGTVSLCNIIFAKEDKDARDELYLKVYQVLHEGLGETGSQGAGFSEQRQMKKSLDSLDTYIWEKAEDEKFYEYGISLCDPEQFTEYGWMGRISDTAGLYGFRLSITYITFGDK